MPSSSKEKQREYDKKRAGRTRNYTAILYPDSLPKNFKQLIIGTRVRVFFSPVHKPEADEKKEHIHVLPVFGNPQTPQQAFDFFADLFGKSETGSINGVARPEKVTDMCSMLRYFAHMDNPEKIQYSVDEIECYNGADLNKYLEYTESERLKMMMEVHALIRSKDIREYSQLVDFLERDPRLLALVCTRNTVHFRAYITSYRNNKKECELMQEALEEGRAYMDEVTGEIKYKKGGRKV